MSSESQLDLTEFVSKLIHDTFNAIAISSKEQAEIYFELTRLASLDYEAFKEKYIDKDAVDDELSRLFPEKNNASPSHAVYEGAAYFFDAESGEEKPDFFNALGVKTEPAQQKENTLSKKTVDVIREVVKDSLASQHYSAFKEIIKRGIPRVVIDSGRILAKLSLKATEVDDTNDSGTTDDVSSGIVRPAITRGILKKSLISRNIQKKMAATRVDVILPDPQKTTTQTTSQLWGEVEIKFRTVD